LMRSDSSGRSFQASLICAGRDDSGGHIFSIATDGGAMWEEDVYCVSGSGSTLLIGHLDSLKLEPSKLYSETKAVDLVLKLLKLSIARDGASGGLIRLMILKKGGIEDRVEYPEAVVRAELPGFADPA
jgi:20S proteasome subunit beta 1